MVDKFISHLWIFSPLYSHDSQSHYVRIIYGLHFRTRPNGSKHCLRSYGESHAIPQSYFLRRYSWNPRHTYHRSFYIYIYTVHIYIYRVFHLLLLFVAVFPIITRLTWVRHFGTLICYKWEYPVTT